ncbi:hypothetical protein HanIR_Chr02g0089401 [Helianthus annuus]|nr:hypothetical protein HanIR_Chr02g0089401 [Helianthus annuus]
MDNLLNYSNLNRGKDLHRAVGSVDESRRVDELYGLLRTTPWPIFKSSGCTLSRDYEFYKKKELCSWNLRFVYQSLISQLFLSHLIACETTSVGIRALVVQMALRGGRCLLDRRFANRGNDRSMFVSRARGEDRRPVRRTADQGNDKVDSDPRDLKIKRLRQRVRDLELQHEIIQLKQRVRDLEDSSSWKETELEDPSGTSYPGMRSIYQWRHYL